jgi:putative exporter of polyketide antibiotics
MLRSRTAEWSYRLGCVSAAVAIVYRALWFGGIGARLFGVAPRVVPHNFVDLSILLLVISIASNARAIFPREEGKPVKTA